MSLLWGVSGIQATTSNNNNVSSFLGNTSDAAAYKGEITAGGAMELHKEKEKEEEKGEGKEEEKGEEEERGGGGGGGRGEGGGRGGGRSTVEGPGVLIGFLLTL